MSKRRGLKDIKLPANRTGTPTGAISWAGLLILAFFACIVITSVFGSLDAFIIRIKEIVALIGS